MEDFQSSISFASTLKNIDSERIGIWGTSLGGRNVLLVAARDKRVKCVVSQVPGMVMTPEMLSYFGGCDGDVAAFQQALRSEEHTSELQSLMSTWYADFCLKKKKKGS